EWEHATPLHGVSVSDDGARVATAAEDGVVRVWDVASSRELQRFAPHEMPVLAVALAGDGTSLVAGSADKSAVLHAISAQRMFIADAAQVADAAFLPDGSAIATAGAELAVQIFDLTGK